MLFLLSLLYESNSFITKEHDREGYERQIGHGANVYAKHYAALEDDTAIKDQLKEIAEVTNKIKKEEGEEKRTELLNTLDLMIDQLLEDR